MPNTVAPEARKAAYSGLTDEAFLTLLTIDHPNLAAPIRVVNNMVNITSRGDIYQAFPFSIALPTEVTARTATATLTISAIDQQIMNAIRSVDSPPTITAEPIRASDPDTVDRVYIMEVAGVQSPDPSTVTLTLIYDSTFYDRYPNPTFGVDGFPGLY